VEVNIDAEINRCCAALSPADLTSVNAFRAKIINAITNWVINKQVPSVELQGGPAKLDWSNRFNIERMLDRASLASGNFARFCVDHNIPSIWGGIATRPFGCWSMGSIMRLMSGIDGAARTYYKMPNMMMADNAMQKLIFGNFTVYTTTVVLNPQMIALQHNTFSNNYIGGNGTRVWDPFNELHLNAYKAGEFINDIFFLLVPQKWVTYNRQSWMSLTGRMPRSLNVTADVNELVNLPGCDGWTKFWGFNTDGREYGNSTFGQYRSHVSPFERKCNVICMQTFQIDYNPSTKLWDQVIESSDHWGPRVYPGVGRVRMGKKIGMEIPSYSLTKTVKLA